MEFDENIWRTTIRRNDHRHPLGRDETPRIRGFHRRKAQHAESPPAAGRKK